MIFIILFGPFLVYSILKFCSIKFNLNYGKKVRKFLAISIAVLSTICIFSEILASKNFSLAGYRTPAILIAITCYIISIYALFRKEIKSEINPLTFIVGALCFTIGSLFIFEITGDYERQLIYNDKKYRIESTGRGIGAPCDYKIFIKGGILENVYDINCPCFLSFEKIDISQKSKNLLNISFVHDSGSELFPNPYEIEIETKN